MRNKFHFFRIFIITIAFLSACTAPLPREQPSPGTEENRPSPTPPPATPVLVDHPVPVIGVIFQLEGSASGKGETTAGSTAYFQLEFVPSQMTITRNQDGSVFSANWEIWKDQPPIQMRTCFSADNPCSPSDGWVSFKPQMTFELPVDWLGEKTFYASAEFQTTSGVVIPAGALYEDKVEQVYSPSISVTSLINDTAGAGQLPAAVLTQQAATQTAFPVTGSVLIENGNCCAGGTEGTQIPLKVQLQASSPAGKVTRMRTVVGACQRGAASLDAPWQPFLPFKTYTVTLMLNWSSFQLNVQYGDEKGNLSPVYCAEISLEGMPKP